MTSTSPSARPALLRGPEQGELAPARLDADLRLSGLAEVGADPRLVDPSLERAFEQAVARGVEAGVRRGYARGHEAGLAAGLAETRAQVEAERSAQQAREQVRAEQVERLLAGLAREAASLQEQRARALALEAPAVVAAALEIAELVLGAVPQAPRDALTRALAAVPDASGAVTARLHPDDAAALGQDGQAPHGVQVVADPQVARGDCLVRAGDTEVDAQLRAGLARVRAVLAP